MKISQRTVYAIDMEDGSPLIYVGPEDANGYFADLLKVSLGRPMDVVLGTGHGATSQDGDGGVP